MQAEPQVVREGWLVKAPSPNNSWRFWDTQWKRRYFVLCSGQVPGESRLIWYQDEQHRRNGKAKGTINLQYCEQVDSNLSLSYERRNRRITYTWIFDVRVNTPKGGSVLYYFSADSEQVMNEWVRILCHVCNLEREDDSDVSNGGGGGNEHFSSRQQQQLQPGIAASHHQQPSPTERRYVETPSSPTTASWTLQNSNQNGRHHPMPTLPNRLTSIHTQSSQLNVVPPAPFIPRPAAPQPPPPQKTTTTKGGAGDETPTPPAKPTIMGYIPLSLCTSNPSSAVAANTNETPTTTTNNEDSPTRGRLGATSCGDQFVELASSTHTSSVITMITNSANELVIVDQPPNFPAPPLPPSSSAVDDNVFQQQQQQHLSQQQDHHSRTPSKDSSVSSVHLSSAESDQGGDGNRRPSVGNNNKTTPTTTQFVGGTLSGGPSSPISPPAAIASSRGGVLGRSSGGASRSSTTTTTSWYVSTDEHQQSMTPPPRPPKTRTSITSQGGGGGQSPGPAGQSPGQGQQQHVPMCYENEPKLPPGSAGASSNSVNNNEGIGSSGGVGGKFTSYDQITFAQRQVISFDTLPNTKTDLRGGGGAAGTRRSRDSTNANTNTNNNNAFSTLPKYSTTMANSEKGVFPPGTSTTELYQSPPAGPQLEETGAVPSSIMTGARSVGNLDADEPCSAAGASSRFRNNSSSSFLTDDTESSYSPFTPGPPRLIAPVPVAAAVARPSVSPSSSDMMDGAGPISISEHYQNFLHPPAPPVTRSSTPSGGSSSNISESDNNKPPDVKRELKPGGPKVRSPVAATSGGAGGNGGVGPLPRVPNRLTDIRKGSANSSGGGAPGSSAASSSSGLYSNPYSHPAEPVFATSDQQQVPQFNVERQVSFKNQRRNMIGHQHPAGTPGSGTGGALKSTAGRSDILDAEVKVESEAQLDYILVSTPPTRGQSTSTTSPGPVTTTTTTTEHHLHHRQVSKTSLITPTPAPGYVQIDPHATGALRRVQEQSEAWRSSQHRTLERNKSLQQQQELQLQQQQHAISQHTSSGGGLFGGRKK